MHLLLTVFFILFLVILFLKLFSLSFEKKFHQATLKLDQESEKEKQKVDILELPPVVNKWFKDSEMKPEDMNDAVRIEYTERISTPQNIKAKHFYSTIHFVSTNSRFVKFSKDYKFLSIFSILESNVNETHFFEKKLLSLFPIKTKHSPFTSTIDTFLTDIFTFPFIAFKKKKVKWQQIEKDMAIAYIETNDTKITANVKFKLTGPICETSIVNNDLELKINYLTFKKFSNMILPATIEVLWKQDGKTVQSKYIKTKKIQIFSPKNQFKK